MKTIRVSDMLRRFADAIDNKANDDRMRSVDPEFRELGIVVKGAMDYATKCGIRLLPRGTKPVGVADGELFGRN